MDLTRITNVEVDGLDYGDFPDLVDAYISYAEYDGEPMSSLELDTLNENVNFVHQHALNYFI